MFHLLVECETLEAFSGRKLQTFTYQISEIVNVIDSKMFRIILFIFSDEEKSPEIKNENDLNTSNKPKEDEEAEKPKGKKASEGNSDEKKTQDNQTPKEQVCWELF